MTRPFQISLFALGAQRHGMALGYILGGAWVAILLVAFAAPAPALDGADQRLTSPTAQLPMFKDPRAALRAGLESYHSGKAGASIEALRYAADGGEYLAQWKLARMYAEGDGVTRDDHKAFDYFSKIVEHFADDDPDPSMRSMASNAFVSVGKYLRAGIASAKLAPDPERAFDLFRYAATFFGDADAQYNLGVCYATGAGVAKNYSEAHKWLYLAAAQGLEDAKEKLPLVDQKMTPEQIDKGQQLAREFKPRKE